MQTSSNVSLSDIPVSALDDVPINVLIVDDRPENRTALKAILSAPDYRIVEAGSGAEALRRMLHEDFAVLLIDVVMPEMNGFELARAIKERERAALVPIVFLTAHADEMDLMHKAYKVGAVDYLTKPLAPDMVRAKVAVFGELHRQKKQIERQAALLIMAERRENELRLLQLELASERHYRGLAEAVPNVIWTARPDGFVDYFNQRWFEYTGISALEAAGTWNGALHRDDVSACERSWQRALHSGQMHPVECRLRRASDGMFHWHLCRAVPERGASGQIVSWLGTFTDIEDQKRAQAVLAEFKGTLDAVLDAVLIFEPENWHLQYVNHGASVLLGYSRDELLAMRLTDVMAELDAASFCDLLEPLHQGKTPALKVETKLRRRDSRAVPVEVSLQLIAINGGRLVAIARDITERRRAQLERELLYREALDGIRARDDFLSVASHELRTPLTSLQLVIEALQRAAMKDRAASLSSEKSKSKLELAARQIERLSRLITELLDLSNVTTGRLRLEREPLDLSVVIRDVVNRLADEAARAHAPITLTASAPIVGEWDRMRVEQVAINLLTNAFKFGGRKPIEVAVEQHDSVGRLRVVDHGIGIPPADVHRIFKRYEQAISPRSYGGLGLGLYIARQIVEAHGGTIHVESQPGAGSTFTVDLPMEPPRAHQDSATETAAAP